MDKHILEQYTDACELIRETEEDIRKLRKKRKEVVQTNVTGSSRDFPYTKTHYKIVGSAFTYNDDRQLRYEEKLLEERKEKAKEIKVQAEAFVNTAPPRMQRIIRFKKFQRLSWDEVAAKMGNGATADSVRKEYEKFLRNK